MNEYRLILSGYGKYIAIGTIDKDTYFFWKSCKPDVVKSQIFLDAYNEEISPGVISDTGDPLFLDIWKKNSNILYERGTYPDETHILVFDKSENLVWASDRINYKLDTRSLELEKGHYLKSWRERKGEYGNITIIDSIFDPEKLSAIATKIDDDTIITDVYYEDQRLFMNEGVVGDIFLGYNFFKIK